MSRPSQPTALLDALSPGALDGERAAVLATLCQQISELTSAAVVSVYVRRQETGGEDFLLMEANVGLAPDVVGNLRLRYGDGAVGHSASMQQTVLLADDRLDPHFKLIRGIGEEDFPVLLAVPLVYRGDTRGALVLQRAATPFSDEDCRLSEVIAAAVTQIVIASAAHEERTEAVSTRLTGVCVAPGFGLGRVDLLPTAEALRSQDVSRKDAASALARLERDIARLKADRASHGEARAALTRLELSLSDALFRERLAGEGAISLSQLARDYARTPFRFTDAGGEPDADLLERARDVEELCAVLHGLASGRLNQNGRIWLSERLGGVLAVVGVTRAAAVLLDGDSSPTADGVAIARAGGLPVVSAVSGLFSWCRPGDLAAVDAERGEVRLNPSATRVMRARSAGQASDASPSE